MKNETPKLTPNMLIIV